MKTERQQDQDVAERLRRENLERTNAPKDNEVDEKAVAWLITYTERDGSKRQAVYTHNAIADWRMFDPAATSEPLYSAATVAELRAEVESLRDTLTAIRQYGSDTLSGRVDGGSDDREWQRDAVREMTKRARVGLGIKLPGEE